MTTAHSHHIPAALRDRADHAPEVLLGAAALLVVLAGPVARGLGPEGAWVGLVAAALLGVGIVLALVAARRVLRDAG